MATNISDFKDTTSVWLCVTCGALNCGRSFLFQIKTQPPYECGDLATEICHECLQLRHATRYVAAHGLKHKEKTKTHSVCMETKQLSVFCYDCDEFVINDTSDK